MEEGDESLERLLGKSISDPELQAQRKEMIAAIRLEEQESLQITFTSMFKRDTTETKITKRIWISWLMQMGKPFFGGNLIVCLVSHSLLLRWLTRGRHIVCAYARHEDGGLTIEIRWEIHYCNVALLK